MKISGCLPITSLNEPGLYREFSLVASDLEMAEFTLQMVADLESPEREQQFLQLTLALDSCQGLISRS